MCQVLFYYFTTIPRCRGEGTKAPTLSQEISRTNIFGPTSNCCLCWYLGNILYVCPNDDWPVSVLSYVTSHRHKENINLQPLSWRYWYNRYGVRPEIVIFLRNTKGIFGYLGFTNTVPNWGPLVKTSCGCKLTSLTSVVSLMSMPTPQTHSKNRAHKG